MSFQVGDRVRIIKQDSQLYGTETTIIRGLTLTRIDSDDGIIRVWAYRVDVRPESGYDGWSFQPQYLQKIGDDHEPGSWDEIEKLTRWNPARAEA